MGYKNCSPGTFQPFINPYGFTSVEDDSIRQQHVLVNADSKQVRTPFKFRDFDDICGIEGHPNRLDLINPCLCGRDIESSVEKVVLG